MGGAYGGCVNTAIYLAVPVVFVACIVACIVVASVALPDNPASLLATGEMVEDVGLATAVNIQAICLGTVALALVGALVAVVFIFMMRG